MQFLFVTIKIFISVFKTKHMIVQTVITVFEYTLEVNNLLFTTKINCYSLFTGYIT